MERCEWSYSDGTIEIKRMGRGEKREGEELFW